MLGATGKEILYFTPTEHTGYLAEATCELLDSTLRIIRDREDLLEKTARRNPSYITSAAAKVIIARPLPFGLQKRWNKRESSVGRLLYAAKAIISPDHIDQKLEELLPSLDPENSESGENFLFGSRERVIFLLTGGGAKILDALNHAAHAYIESRVVRMAITKGVSLTQQTA